MISLFGRHVVRAILCVLLLGLWASASATVVQVRVSSNNDDAEERVSDGDMYRGSSDLELGYDDYRGGTQIVGMRFRNVNVPQGATIRSAYIEFETDETDSGTTNLIIYGQDANNAGGIGNGSSNLSNRIPTSAQELWSPGAWNSTNQLHQTPDISRIIQEIVNRSGWTANNSLLLMIAPGAGCNSVSCQRTAESHNGEQTAAPLLVIDYSDALPAVDNVSGACGSDNIIVVEYAGSVGSEALDLSLYSLDVGTVTSAFAQSSTVVILEASGLDSGSTSTLTVDGTDYAIDFQGLMGHYFDQRNGSGSKVSEPAGLFTGTEYFRLDSQVNFAWNSGAPSVFPAVSGNSDRFSIRWTGYLTPDQGGSYEFRLYSDDGMRLDLDGSEIVNDWSRHSPRYSGTSSAQTLGAGQVYPIEVEFFEHTGRAYAQLEWRRDGGAWQNIPAANLNTCPLVVAAPTPVLEYRMDETRWSGSPQEVLDSTGNSGDGSSFGGANTVASGHICRAGEFDGVDDYVDVGTGTLDTLLATASMSFWIKTTQTGNNTGWRAPGVTGIEENGGSDDIFWGWLDASGHIGISVANDFNTKSTVPINDDVFHHVVLTRDHVAGEYKIYIDGVLDNSGSIGTGIIGNPFQSLGRIEDTGTSPEYFQGILDEIKIFDAVLSDAEVTLLFNETRPCNNKLPIAHYAFEQSPWTTAGTVIEDDSGNGNDGVSVGNAADNADGYVCRGVDIPFNNSTAEIDAINSRLDINTALGNEGTIMLWYRASEDWAGNGTVNLLDATTDVLGNANDKYFFLSRENNGRLRFALEDSADRDFNLYTGANAYVAGTWVHVAITWDLPNDAMEIYINGSREANRSTSSNGVLGDLGSIYFGDNSSTYLAPGASAYGRLDEIRLYTEVLSDSEIGVALSESHPCNASCTLDHFDIQQDDYGLACPQARTSVTITAQCADDSTKTDYVGTVSLSSNESTESTFYAASTGGSAIGNISFDGSESGTATVYLFHSNVNPAVTVIADDGSVSSTSSDSTEFAANGFVASNPAGFSCGGSTSVTLTAIGQDTASGGTCVQLTGFDGSKNLKVWSDINIDIAESPGVKDTGLPRSMQVNGSNTASSQPASNNVVANFNNGVGTLNIEYLDVGEILNMHVRHDDSPYDGSVAEFSALTATLSPFVVTPDRIVVSADDPVDAACNSSDESVLGSCPDFAKAGEDFAITTQALCSDSGPSLAPSYRGTVGLTHQLIAPSSGTTGSLNVSQVLFDGSEVTPGQRATANQQFSEVGIFSLTTVPQTYFGETVSGATSANIGRFIPDHFLVSASDGEFENACGSFSYVGQAFGYATGMEPNATITARSAGNTTTQNYTDANFIKLTASDITRSFPTQDSTSMGADGLTRLNVTSSANLGTVSVSSPGVLLYVFDTSDDYRYDKDGNSLVPPFLSDLSVSATAITDADSVSATALPTWTPQAVSLRYGRWRTENVFGPENEDLAMLGQSEYLDASGNFVLNTADSCTDIATGMSVTDSTGSNVSSPYNNIAVGDGSSALSYNATLSGGLADLVFSAPGLASSGDQHVGSIGFALDLASQPWLRFDWNGDASLDANDDQQHSATFGQYRGHDRIIYWREVLP